MRTRLLHGGQRENPEIITLEDFQDLNLSPDFWGRSVELEIK